MHSLQWCNLSKFRNRAIFRTLLSKVFHEIVCVFFGLRTGADVLGVLYLASECIFHFGPRGIWYFELGVIWQVFARICHFGLGGIWQVFACIWYFGLGGVLFRRILSSEGKSSSDGGKSETCSHNATISAFFLQDFYLDWIADKSFKLLNIIILQKSLLHVRTTQAASQCGQCKQC